MALHGWPVSIRGPSPRSVRGPSPRSGEHSPLAGHRLAADECLIPVAVGLAGALAGGPSMVEDEGVSPLGGTAWLAGEHPRSESEVRRALAIGSPPASR